ncbi:hypothetical protein P3342_005825 [Pyrenophora teres f. teres]|uniref:Uncharacterized protein n=2 Tax=Pyrenophora teres f. teres TaxID=97479 RepID=E3RJX8_PYRTT|nr:hypothetical protein PTT_08494 [Pyrenophora teres f. teres 0-1]KAE8845740.1 hypothetical protein HRS9139_00307 [Pyrenophora teres f. teres]KAE8847879.1 hypothetical protein PTNB85_01722 [Pyrenophora teres f. teres]KAE8853962.1 hypothetical protein HRS9122_00954 [Pyrenophora teres f. teres]KAE8867806.1 hypothetical protein PTNB29_01717 [Pyrenophora teres f. teres]
MDFASWDPEEELTHCLEIHHPSIWNADPPPYLAYEEEQPTFGNIISGPELRGLLKALTWPKYASLDPIMVRTTARCKMLKMWFTGDGYMRMVAVMGSKKDLENGREVPIIWSGIKMTPERENERTEEERARSRLLDEEQKAKEAAERKKSREEWDRHNAACLR